GVAVVRTGNTGGITTLFTRGGNSDYTKVLVDGIPVNQPGGAYDFAHLPTDNVSTIEVVRGPQSALFGSDALTGVVQIFTTRVTANISRHALPRFLANRYSRRRCARFYIVRSERSCRESRARCGRDVYRVDLISPNAAPRVSLLRSRLQLLRRFRRLKHPTQA